MLGLRRKCPCCGEASAFKGYLKVVDSCAKCQTPLGLYPCDDGPAYVTMLLVGHVVIGPLFIFEHLWASHLDTMIPLAMAAMGLLTLMVLPFIKGAFLGLVWHHGIRQNS